MNFVEGAVWDESHAGINAPGTALALDHAVQIFSAEHFRPTVQAWTCAAAPIHDPATGRILGIVDITGGDIVAHMQDTYRGFVREGTPRFAEFFAHLLAADEPTVFHCTAGKDRTGFAAALLLKAGRLLSGLPVDRSSNPSGKRPPAPPRHPRPDRRGPAPPHNRATYLGIS